MREEGGEGRERIFIVSFPNDLGQGFRRVVEDYSYCWSRDSMRSDGKNSTEQRVVELTPSQALSFKDRMIKPSSSEDFPPFMIFSDHTFRYGPQGGDRLMNIIFHGRQTTTVSK